MPLKIALVSPLATVAPHFETELELLQRHLDAGDQAYLLACEGSLPGCDFNPSPDAEACRRCAGRRLAGLRLLVGRVRRVSLRSELTVAVPDPAQFATIEDLKQYWWGSFDLGYAVASSLISLTRDPSPELYEQRLLVSRLLHAAVATYEQVARFLKDQRPDRVYVFNGRFAAVRAVLRACQAAGVDCWIHERGCDPHHYQIYRNHLPHEIEYLQARMRDAWEQSPRTTEEKTELAAQWFRDRVARSERSWHSFVKDQAAGRLPPGWDPQAQNVVLFTSSEDEFASIGDTWRPPFYSNQWAGVERILADWPASHQSLRLYVRVHPNLKGQDTADLRRWLNLRHPQVVVLGPEDPTDSYQLLRDADKVVTFGSSIGVEALFWGKPSLLLGTSYYRGFRGIYQPTDHADAVRLLAARLAPPDDRSDALRYGYWFQTHGIRFRYFEPDGLFGGKFKGQIVHAPQPRPPLPLRWMRKLRRAVTGRRRAPGQRDEPQGQPR